MQQKKLAREKERQKRLSYATKYHKDIDLSRGSANDDDSDLEIINAAKKQAGINIIDDLSIPYDHDTKYSPSHSASASVAHSDSSQFDDNASESSLIDPLRAEATNDLSQSSSIIILNEITDTKSTRKAPQKTSRTKPKISDVTSLEDIKKLGKRGI